MTVAWGLLGWMPESETVSCSYDMAPPGDEGQLWLASEKAPSSLHCNGCFDLFRVLLHTAVAWFFGIACTQNALEWLHVCCIGLALERVPERPRLFFSRVKWLQLMMKGRSCWSDEFSQQPIVVLVKSGTAKFVNSKCGRIIILW